MNKFNSEFLNSNATKFYQVISDWNDKQKKRLQTRDYQFYQTKVKEVLQEDLATDFEDFKQKLKSEFLKTYLPKEKKMLDTSIIDNLIRNLNLAKLTNGDVKEVLQAFSVNYKDYDLTPLKAIVGDEFKFLFINELNEKIDRVNELAQVFDTQNIFTFVKVNQFFMLDIEEQPTNNYDLLNVLQRIANDKIFK